jgi:hypothetical protein
MSRGSQERASASYKSESLPCGNEWSTNCKNEELPPNGLTERSELRGDKSLQRPHILIFPLLSFAGADLQAVGPDMASPRERRPYTTTFVHARLGYLFPELPNIYLSRDIKSVSERSRPALSNAAPAINFSGALRKHII